MWRRVWVGGGDKHETASVDRPHLCAASHGCRQLRPMAPYRRVLYSEPRTTVPAQPMLSNRIVPLIVAVSLFMENMDSTVIATSLPAIAADIGTSPLALKLAITSYLLSLAVFLP